MRHILSRWAIKKIVIINSYYESENKSQNLINAEWKEKYRPNYYEFAKQGMLDSQPGWSLISYFYEVSEYFNKIPAFERRTISAITLKREILRLILFNS